MRTEIIDENEVYSRIISNMPYGKNLKPYSSNLIKKIIKIFEELEDYEKCQVLLNFHNERFEHKIQSYF